MKPIFRVLLLFAFAGLVAACDATPSKPVSNEEFYRGKTITIVVGYTAGGIYDNASRIVSRHLGKHVPGHPSVIVQNMPGGSSFTAANHVYHVAPKDGTTMGMFSNGALTASLFGFRGARYDAREVNWIGALVKRNSTVIAVRGDSPTTTLEGAMKTEVVLGAASVSSATATTTLLLNELIGTKFKLIAGYPGYPETLLAVENGEVHGRGATSWTTLSKEHSDWVSSGFIVPMAQLTVEPISGLENVPRALDFAKNEADRKLMATVFESQRLAFIFSMAPGVEEQRLTAIHKAFADTMKDPEFQEDFRTHFAEPLNPSFGPELQSELAQFYALPKDVIARASQYIKDE